jgi:uncharacterized membrane protein YdfJ with MMPL/SSD domain
VSVLLAVEPAVLRAEGRGHRRQPGRARRNPTAIPVRRRFGLSTDYGVFLLSRIKEAHDAGATDTDAVATGLERVGRITTAAAVLFAVAIGAFVTSEMIFIKQLGLGTALAVLIDATIIRALLESSRPPCAWRPPSPR